MISREAEFTPRTCTATDSHTTGIKSDAFIPPSGRRRFLFSVVGLDQAVLLIQQRVDDAVYRHQRRGRVAFLPVPIN